MTDLIARLRDADTTRRIGESYADTHERRQRDRDEAADRIEQLEAENASLATWQCEFTDGKTGLVYGQGGTTFCIMAKRMQQLEAEVKVWQGHAKTAIWSDSEECKFLTARIEQLEKALRKIEEIGSFNSKRVVLMVAIARTALDSKP